jgi:hypothetical protein
MKTKTFLQLESQLVANGSVTIDTSSSSSKMMSYYLRAIRGRNDLAAALDAVAPDGGFIRRLEQARVALKSNKLHLAEALLLKTLPSTDEELAELLLEKARLCLFKRDYENGENFATGAIQLNVVSEVSLMTLFQVRGLIRTNLKKYSDAISDLKVAIGFSETMSFAHSAFSAHTVRAKA